MTLVICQSITQFLVICSYHKASRQECVMGSPYSEVTQAWNRKGFDVELKSFCRAVSKVCSKITHVCLALSAELCKHFILALGKKNNSPWHSNSNHPRGDGLKCLGTMSCSMLLSYFLSGLIRLTVYSAPHLAEELTQLVFLTCRAVFFPGCNRESAVLK